MDKTKQGNIKPPIITSVITTQLLSYNEISRDTKTFKFQNEGHLGSTPISTKVKDIKALLPYRPR